MNEIVPGKTPFAATADLPEARATAQRIFIRDLKVAACIGVTKKERSSRQRLSINLELEIEPRPVREDHITEVVDYTDLIEEVHRIALTREVRLLEFLAENLARACFFHPRIRAVRVKVEKLDLMPEAAGIGIEIERQRGFKG